MTMRETVLRFIIFFCLFSTLLFATERDSTETGWQMLVGTIVTHAPNPDFDPTAGITFGLERYHQFRKNYGVEYAMQVCIQNGVIRKLVTDLYGYNATRLHHVVYTTSYFRFPVLASAKLLTLPNGEKIKFMMGPQLRVALTSTAEWSISDQEEVPDDKVPVQYRWIYDPRTAIWDNTGIEFKMGVGVQLWPVEVRAHYVPISYIYRLGNLTIDEKWSLLSFSIKVYL